MTDAPKITVDPKPNFTIEDKPPASSGDKPRRGRPPGSKNRTSSARGSASNSSTVSQAVAAMDSLYTMTVMGLTMFGLTGSAAILAEKLPDLRKSNEESLKASPRLAAAIANAGSVGGATAFFAANAMAFAPVILAARIEMGDRFKPEKENPERTGDVLPFPGA